jgi:flagellar hook-associated protein 3 FlgL
VNFNTNNSITISDIKTDFFGQIDEIIRSVEAERIRADGTKDDPRAFGVQNAIQSLDDLQEHFFNQHSIAGVQSQTLQTTADRTDMLIITTQTLRSETIDVDFAEASLQLKQLELNYQAMLSTVSRISQLSLVNYL